MMNKMHALQTGGLSIGVSLDRIFIKGQHSGQIMF